MTFGGFPEPFLAGSERVLRRWHKERLERFFREDVHDPESLLSGIRWRWTGKPTTSRTASAACPPRASSRRYRERLPNDWRCTSSAHGFRALHLKCNFRKAGRGILAKIAGFLARVAVARGLLLWVAYDRPAVIPSRRRLFWTLNTYLEV
jgi:hypothetical protein